MGLRLNYRDYNVRAALSIPQSPIQTTPERLSAFDQAQLPLEGNHLTHNGLQPLFREPHTLSLRLSPLGPQEYGMMALGALTIGLNTPLCLVTISPIVDLLQKENTRTAVFAKKMITEIPGANHNVLGILRGQLEDNFTSQECLEIARYIWSSQASSDILARALGIIGSRSHLSKNHFGQLVDILRSSQEFSPNERIATLEDISSSPYISLEEAQSIEREIRSSKASPQVIFKALNRLSRNPHLYAARFEETRALYIENARRRGDQELIGKLQNLDPHNFCNFFSKMPGSASKLLSEIILPHLFPTLPPEIFYGIGLYIDALTGQIPSPALICEFLEQVSYFCDTTLTTNPKDAIFPDAFAAQIPHQTLGISSINDFLRTNITNLKGYRRVFGNLAKNIQGRMIRLVNPLRDANGQETGFYISIEKGTHEGHAGLQILLYYHEPLEGCYYQGIEGYLGCLQFLIGPDGSLDIVTFQGQRNDYVSTLRTKTEQTETASRLSQQLGGLQINSILIAMAIDLARQMGAPRVRLIAEENQFAYQDSLREGKGKGLYSGRARAFRFGKVQSDGFHEGLDLTKMDEETYQLYLAEVLNKSEGSQKKTPDLSAPSVRVFLEQARPSLQSFSIKPGRNPGYTPRNPDAHFTFHPSMT